MKITENQFRNIQVLFTLLFAVNIGFTIWNIYETHQSRVMERQILEEKLNQLRNGKKEEEEN